MAVKEVQTAKRPFTHVARCCCPDSLVPTPSTFHPATLSIDGMVWIFGSSVLSNFAHSGPSTRPQLRLNYPANVRKVQADYRLNVIHSTQ